MKIQGEAIGYIGKLQRAIGVTVDIFPGPQTLAACHTLQEGDSGDVVESLQFFVGAPRDGQFGPETKRKVKEFQRWKGIVQDGIVGRGTGRAMLKLLMETLMNININFSIKEERVIVANNNEMIFIVYYIK